MLPVHLIQISKYNTQSHYFCENLMDRNLLCLFELGTLPRQASPTSALHKYCNADLGQNMQFLMWSWPRCSYQNSLCSRSNAGAYQSIIEPCEQCGFSNTDLQTNTNLDRLSEVMWLQTDRIRGWSTSPLLASTSRRSCSEVDQGQVELESNATMYGVLLPCH